MMNTTAILTKTGLVSDHDEHILAWSVEVSRPVKMCLIYLDDHVLKVKYSVCRNKGKLPCVMQQLCLRLNIIARLA